MVVLWALFWILNIGSAYGRITLKYINCSVENRDVLEVQTCKLNMLARNRVVANAVGSLKVDVSKAYLQVELKKKYNGWRPFMYSRKFELCDYFRHPKRYVLVDATYYYLKNYTNFNHTCPYKRGEQIQLNNFEFDENHFLNKYPVDIGTYGAFATLSCFGKVVLKGAIVAEYSDYRGNGYHRSGYFNSNQ